MPGDDTSIFPANAGARPRLRHLEIVEEMPDLAGEELGTASQVLDRLGHVIDGARGFFGRGCDGGGVGEHMTGAVRRALGVAGDLAGGRILLLDGAGELRG